MSDISNFTEAPLTATPPRVNITERLTVCAIVLAYVSAIQDISLSPVLMSGAGTSMPGPKGKGERGRGRKNYRHRGRKREGE